ncbi:MAG TPA: HAD family hydrolase [Acidimicrobiales bacterium]|nr:HAD family hydrolase [Acidimicrobiales bacterium]
MTTWIGLDGDDTLWHSERHFVDAQRLYNELLSDYIDTSELHDRLMRTERRNLEIFGYGVKGFTLSLVETAIEMTDGSIGGADVQRIIDLGKEVLQHPVELLDGVAEGIDGLLTAGHRLVIITKGDLLHQETKVAQSGLADVVDGVEIVAEKDAQTYQNALGRHGIDSADFTMVGNSVRSDVLPVLEIGGRAIHIEYEYTWDHEVVSEHDRPEGYEVATSFADVPTLVSRE